MTTSTDNPTTAAPQLPSATKPPLQIVGWLLTYRDGTSEFLAGATRPSLYSPDCEEIAAVVLACDAEAYAHSTAARQRALCDDAWDAVETLQRVGACQAAHHRKQIQALEAEVTRLKQRERICETMDQAEKIALVRALQECAEALGIGNTNPSPAALVAAVTAAINERDDLRARPAEIEAQEPVGWQQRTLFDGQWSDWQDCNWRTANILRQREDYEVRGVYARPVPAQAVLKAEGGADYTLRIVADSGYEATTTGRCTAEQYGAAIGALHNTAPEHKA